MADSNRHKYISLDATRLTYKQIRELRGEISPWVENKEPILPPLTANKTIEQSSTKKEPERHIERPKIESPRQLPVSSTTRKLSRQPYQSKPKLKRDLHRIRYSDINEMAALTLIPLSEGTAVKESKTLSNSKNFARLEMLTLETTNPKPARTPDDDELLQKQFSRFLYEMHSEAKIPYNHASRRNPVEFSRKRRIMELLTLNRVNETAVKHESPKNLKVAFDKFDSFLPNYPKKQLLSPPRKMQLFKRSII